MNPSDLQKIADKLPLSESVRRLNGMTNERTGHYGAPNVPGGVKVAGDQSKSLISRLRRPLTIEERLNKLEREFFAYLQAGLPPGAVVLAQSITLELATGLRYRPDFFLQSPQAQGIFYETKGPHRFAEKGIQKTKMAARLYLWWRFVLVQRIKGDWKFTEVRA